MVEEHLGTFLVESDISQFVAYDEVIAFKLDFQVSQCLFRLCLPDHCQQMRDRGKEYAETAQYQDELNVTLVFEATEAGEYTGNVVISTNAGDFTVECAGKAVKLETDYQPIVTEGDFSFCTDLDYPFIVEDDKAYSSTSYIDFNGKVISWLEAEFVVPEGKQATLSWTGLNSSEDWFNFMGQLSFNDGTRIKIDGETIGEFCGEVDASSSDIEEQASLTLLPGRHTLRFEYEKILTTPKGNEQVHTLKPRSANGRLQRY